jgi:hypothetical protein
MRSRPALLVPVLAALATAQSADARADAGTSAAPDPSPAAPSRSYVRLLGGVSFGGGMRFNNPYRLATVLGRTAESVSATAPYAQISAGATFGPPDGLQHGGTLGLSFALAGVSQAVLAPGYLMLYRGPRSLLFYGRGGPAIVLSPNPNVGLEAGAGAAWFATGGVGLSLDVAGDLFYGAGTRDVKYAVYPVLSASLGLLVDLEVLP